MLSKVFQTVLVLLAMAFTGWAFHWAMQDHLSIASATASTTIQQMDERGGVVKAVLKEPQAFDIVVRNHDSKTKTLALSLSSRGLVEVKISIDGRVFYQGPANDTSAQEIQLNPGKSHILAVQLVPAHSSIVEVVLQPVL